MLRVVRTGPHPTSTSQVLRLQAGAIALSLCDDGNWARVLSKHSINLDTCLRSPEVLLHCIFPVYTELIYHFHYQVMFGFCFGFCFELCVQWHKFSTRQAHLDMTFAGP